jgi:hypothetical protein
MEQEPMPLPAAARVLKNPHRHIADSGFAIEPLPEMILP